MIGRSSISNLSEYDITFSSRTTSSSPARPGFWRKAWHVSASAMRPAHSRVICGPLSHSAIRIRPGTAKVGFCSCNSSRLPGVHDSIGAKVRSGAPVNLSLSPTTTRETGTSLQTTDESANDHSCLNGSEDKQQLGLVFDRIRHPARAAIGGAEGPRGVSGLFG
jgi:hypothetical protein